MAGSGFIYFAVPTLKIVVFVCCARHSVAAASAEHLAPQRVGVGILLGTFEPGPLGLHLSEQLPADDSRMMVGNLDPLAFILHPYPVSAYLCHLPLAHDVEISIILALGLNSRIRAKGFFRGAYFLPNILGSLIVGYIFNYFFTYILPALADMVGIEALRSSILSSPSKAWIGVMIVCAWQAVAMNTIIYISGLQTVPEDVYEAGGLDGATGWKQFRHLTFPLIIPFFSINMVLCVKNFLMVFDQIMALTKGGPAQSTESISYLIYNNGMSGGQFGFQSANAVVFFIVIVIISVAQMKFTSSKEEQL